MGSNLSFILILIVLFLAVFFGFSLSLLFVNQNILIDKNSIDLLDMYIRAGFVLIGSTLSGIVAFFIFSLQERSKIKEKKENEIKHYQNTKEEFEDNLKALKKISKMMEEGSLSELAKEIVEVKEVKEIFLTVYTQLDFTFYSNFQKEINSQDYFEEIKVFKFSYQIYKYIDLITNKLEDKENIETILELIKDDMYDIKEVYNTNVKAFQKELNDDSK